MGIKSTVRILRNDAIERIKEVDYLIFKKKYRDLEECTSEHDYDIRNYVDRYNVNYSDVDLTQWTDTMLEDKMDEPFYRYSMFNNYLIGEEKL